MLMWGIVPLLIFLKEHNSQVAFYLLVGKPEFWVGGLKEVTSFIFFFFTQDLLSLSQFGIPKTSFIDFFFNVYFSGLFLFFGGRQKVGCGILQGEENVQQLPLIQ